MNNLLLAATITIAPIPGVDGLGELPLNKLVEFQYNSGTILAPLSRINPDPFIEQYGPGSHIPNGSGSSHSNCWTMNIVMDSNGVIYVNCDIIEDKF